MLRSKAIRHVDQDFAVKRGTQLINDGIDGIERNRQDDGVCIRNRISVRGCRRAAYFRGNALRFLGISCADSDGVPPFCRALRAYLKTPARLRTI